MLPSYSKMRKSLLVFGVAYFALLILVLGLQYAYPKAELHMMVNSYHTGILDTFFKYYSMMAEWPLYVLALLPLFWKKIGMTVFFASSELTGGTMLQILKHLICLDRPITVFENHPDMILPLVQGVNMYHSNSFPSGHASTFFVFCTCCAIVLTYQSCKIKSRKPQEMVPDLFVDDGIVYNGCTWSLLTCIPVAALPVGCVHGKYHRFCFPMSDLLFW